MAENTKIQWTDYTFNPWRGCTKVAEGCKFCYAEVNYSVKMHGVKWGPNGTRVRLSDAGWKEPLKWEKKAIYENAQRIGPTPRPRVFCASLADVFEDWDGPILNHHGEPLIKCPNCGIEPNYASPGEAGCANTPLTMADLRRDLFALIDATPHLDWLLLTKRPENIRKMWPWGWGTAETFDQAPQQVPTFPHGVLVDKGAPYRPNCWLLTSIATQADADRNIPELLKCRDLSPVLGVSAEPLIEAVDLQRAFTLACPNNRQCKLDPDTRHRIIQDSTEGGLWVECACSRLGGLSWVIVGGESGPNARPFTLGWGKDVIRQCQAAGVPVFMKQVGAMPVNREGECCPNIKDPKGGDMLEWPENLRVREFPVPSPHSPVPTTNHP